MKQLLSAIALAMALLMGSTAMADDGYGRRVDGGNSYRHDYRGHRDYRGRGSYDDRKSYQRHYYGDRYGHRYSDRYRSHDYDRRYNDRRYYDRRHYDRKYYGGKLYRNGYYRSWRRGDRLSGEFFTTRFVVNDFRSYGLYSPPRGYRWHRVGDDAFLVGVATGLIVGISADCFS